MSALGLKSGKPKAEQNTSALPSITDIAPRVNEYTPWVECNCANDPEAKFEPANFDMLARKCGGSGGGDDGKHHQ
jgi:hypothetical protein